MALALHFAARSDVGLLREGNEDSAYAGPRLLAVADGMGGHAAGEVASSVAVATLSALDEDSAGPDLLDRLAAAVEAANTHLREMVAGDPDLRGMGTTLTALLRAGSRFGLVHVGDSRCYLMRGGSLQQVTHDHTFVQSLVDEGRISAEEAAHHPQRSLITNVLDGRENVDLDMSVREARAGDRWMLCSDGLSGVVSEQTLAETLTGGSPATAADALVALALRGGGPDNVTVIVADVVDVDSSPSDIPEVVGAVTSGPVRHHRDGPGRTATASAAARAAALARTPEPAESAGTREHDDRHRRRRWPWAVGLLVLLAAVVAGGSAAYSWSRDQYYVSADDDGMVAIYRGLSQNILGIPLSSVYDGQDIAVRDLSDFERGRVRAAIPADNLADARVIVGRLRHEATRCAGQGAVTPSPSPSGAVSSSTPPGLAPAPTQSRAATSGPATSGPATSGPATSGPATSGPATSGCPETP